MKIRIMTIRFKKMILVAGSGRNVGKTTLACRLIRNLSEHFDVTAIKISSHLHRLTHQQKIIYQVEGVTVSEELDQLSSKDSARFLRAGAIRSLFIQVDGQHFAILADWLNQHLTGWVVCESAILGKYIVPHTAIFVEGDHLQKEPGWNFPFIKTRMIDDCFTNDAAEIGIDVSKLFGNEEF